VANLRRNDVRPIRIAIALLAMGGVTFGLGGGRVRLGGRPAFA